MFEVEEQKQSDFTTVYCKFGSRMRGLTRLQSLLLLLFVCLFVFLLKTLLRKKHKITITAPSYVNQTNSQNFITQSIAFTYSAFPCR